TLSNASGQSEGLDGDQFKLGGTRLDLDVLCGPDNRRCKIAADGSLLLNEQGLVQFDAKDKDGDPVTLEQFLQTPEGKKLAGPTGGVQGYKGT
ncbi:hypothetical protein OFP26_31950, partial [Escherichia coli]|nr:hypothetical protein [Escherichia coli]